MVGWCVRQHQLHFYMAVGRRLSRGISRPGDTRGEGGGMLGYSCGGKIMRGIL